MSVTLHLPAPLLRELREQAEEARPHEACGLLIGRREPPSLLALHPAINRGPAGRFLIDALDLLVARDRAVSEGLEVLGPWHSHPGGDCAPSPADHAAAKAWPGSLWLVVGRSIRAFRAGDGGLQALLVESEEQGDVLQSPAL